MMPSSCTAATTEAKRAAPRRSGMAFAGGPADRPGLDVHGHPSDAGESCRDLVAFGLACSRLLPVGAKAACEHVRPAHPPVGGELAEEVDFDFEVSVPLPDVQGVARGDPVAAGERLVNPLRPSGRFLRTGRVCAMSVSRSSGWPSAISTMSRVRYRSTIARSRRA
jgi:hypothetical protein